MSLSNNGLASEEVDKLPGMCYNLRVQIGAHVKSFQRTFRLKAVKPQLLAHALMHPSAMDHPSRREQHLFERLEFLGDAVLGLCISRKLIELYPSWDEGHLSKMRAALVSREHLFRIVQDLRFSQYVTLGASERRKPETEKKKVLSDALEAVIGALYSASGVKPAEKFIHRIFEGQFSTRRLHFISRNPKGELQEWIQKKYAVLPTYDTREANGRYLATVRVANSRRLLGRGEGKRKKEAEAKAASALLKKLKP